MPDAAPISTAPPDAQPGDITIRGNNAIGPGSVGVFASKRRAGWVNFGSTSIATFVRRNPTLFPGISSSRLNVMKAVSDNEGKLEAINSYDSAFLSFGVFQWTAGPGDGAGELADLLNRLKTNSPNAFQTYFGEDNLDIQLGGASPGVPRTGFLVLNNSPLKTAASKAVLRQPIWAYRFWRAGHDNDVCVCEIEQALGRIDVFYPLARNELGGKAIKDYITSEYGVALLLDEHVNRPGHVPKTLVTAIKAFVAKTGKRDPVTWTTVDEKDVLTRYLAARAATNMTNSTGRANSIHNAVAAGELSDKRGTFV
jgi:hypothetical protein